LTVLGQYLGGIPSKKQAIFVGSAPEIVASTTKIVGSFPVTTRLCGVLSS
jgi:hypothetical protein